MSEEAKQKVPEVPSQVPKNKENLGASLAKPKVALQRKVTLPSKGVFYGDQLPGGEVVVQPMTIKEEKLLANPATDRSELINTLVESCVELPFGIDELLVGDKLFLLFMIRAVSYGSKYGFELKCPSCGTKNVHEIKVPEEMGLRVLGPEDTEPFFTELPVCGRKVGLRLLRVKDERYVERQMKRQKNQPVFYDEYCTRLALHVVTVDDNELSTMDCLEFVSNLYSQDSLAISSSIEEMDCGPDLLLNVQCPRCGDETEEAMPLTVEFFRPRTARGR